MAKNIEMKIARATKLMTQLSLSEKCGCKERDILMIETGRSSPSYGLAVRIAEVLEVPLGELFPSMAELSDMRKKC